MFNVESIEILTVPVKLLLLAEGEGVELKLDAAR